MKAQKQCTGVLLMDVILLGLSLLMALAGSAIN